MMSKLDRRLINEILEGQQQMAVVGKTAQYYPVTIEMKQALSPRQGQTRTDTLRDLMGQAQAYQASVVNVLTSMGVVNFQVLPLSNSIKADLTIEQIETVAKHPDVKIVRLVKAERVTT